jgi:NADH-quinone oxidoreductase subunit N
MAAATATHGNLAALGQTNLKRLLAYSTIAHAGYMLMALVTFSPAGTSAVLFYLVGYLLMNLGAFACVAFLRNQTGSEDLASFAGMIQRSPFVVAMFAIFLCSLLGIPPLVGFAAKFQVFASLFDVGQFYSDRLPALSFTLYGLLALAGLNTVISAAYYLKILRVMILDAAPEDSGKSSRVSVGAIGLLSLLAALTIVAGVLWNPLTGAANRAANSINQPASMTR